MKFRRPMMMKHRSPTLPILDLIHMPPSKPAFRIAVHSVVKGHSIGFSTNEEGFILAVVPRFWFSPYEPPEVGFLDESRILVVPEKSRDEGRSRQFFSSVDIKPSTFKDDKGRTWAEAIKTVAKPRPFPEDVEAIKQRDRDRVHALFNMLYAGEKYSQRSLSLGVVQHSKEFQVLLFKAVIDMVSKNMRELRGVYQKQRIETHTIRGRIDFSASSKYIAVGMPKFVCLTNVFGVQSRHYSALMTAFEHIATNMTTNQSFLSELVEQFSKKARIERSRFREIPTLNRGLAIQVLRNEPLPPQLHKWRVIFEFALAVLEGKTARISKGDHAQGNVMYRCSDLWEDILNDVLAHARDGNWEYNKHTPATRPWKKETDDNNHETDKRLRPDFHVFSEDVDVVIDAKYYDSDNLTSVVNKNQYQMLAYALVRLGKKGQERYNRKRKVVLIAPHSEDDENQQTLFAQPDHQKYEFTVPFTHIAGPDNALPKLQAMTLQFPPCRIYLDEQKRRTYLEKSGNELREMITQYFNSLLNAPAP